MIARCFAALACVVLLAGCAHVETLSPLEALLPSHSIAVVVAKKPELLKFLVPSSVPDVPWANLDVSRPWVAALLPGSPPGLLAALAVNDRPEAWKSFAGWARSQGGFRVTRVGNYAVLTTPGVTWNGPQDPSNGYSLNRLQPLSDPLALEVQLDRLSSLATWPAPLLPAVTLLSGISHHSVLTAGLAGDTRGIRMTVALDGKGGTTAPASLERPDASNWTQGLELSHGIQAAAALTESDWNGLISLLPDPLVARRARDLVPLLGSRLALEWLSGTPSSWSLVLDSPDPLGVRQALRTVVAGGDLQRLFPYWAWDPDTAVLYRDTVGPGGLVQGELRVGATVVEVTYGAHRVVFSSGPRAFELSVRGRTFSEGSAGWAQPLPRRPVVFRSDWWGIISTGTIRRSPSGGWRLEVRVDQDSVSVLRSEFPRRLLDWLEGSAGSPAGLP